MGLTYANFPWFGVLTFFGKQFALPDVHTDNLLVISSLIINEIGWSGVIGVSILLFLLPITMFLGTQTIFSDVNSK